MSGENRANGYVHATKILATDAVAISAMEEGRSLMLLFLPMLLFVTLLLVLADTSIAAEAMLDKISVNVGT
jgi:hypothetical protein